MRIIIDESGVQTVLEIQEFVHYANVTSEIGNSTHLAMSQLGVSEAINRSALRKIFRYPGDIPDTNPDVDQDLEHHIFQDYLDYLKSVQEDESNRYPELPMGPIFQEYLEHIGYTNPEDSETEAIYPVQDGTITEEALGYIIITDEKLVLQEGLPIGFTFSVMVTENAIELEIQSGVFIGSGTAYDFLVDGVLYELIKLTESEWIIIKLN